MTINVANKTTALLVMDVQNDIVRGFSAEVERTGMLTQLRKLMDHCRDKNLLVIHVLIDLQAGTQPRMPTRGQFFSMVAGGAICKRGTPGGEVHKTVAPIDGEPLVYKCLFSAFACSGLEEVLNNAGITDLILTGIATDAVVESTGWDASDRGYSTILATDCCASSSKELHDQTVSRMASRCDISDVNELIQAIK
ncbi:MAG: cysteine hydrolase [Pseudomonadales bacterium]|nr:cysteine hydrolase [Pseudomonadales bacterium]